LKLKTLGALLIAGPLIPISTQSTALSRPKVVSIQVIKHEIKAAALRHGLSPGLYLAIVTHESRLDLQAYNTKTHDTGLAQVNRQTAKTWKLDALRLKHDYKYNLNSGALILADFRRRYESREPKTWPCRYNLGSKPIVGPRLAACLRYLDKIGVKP
jgi:soluble lytic murein transglycosylase-like protein